MDGNRYQLELLAEMERRGALPCRIEVPYRIPVEITGDPISKAVELTAEFKTDKLSCGRVKMFMDGVFDSWTAVVVGEYPDKPGFAGEPIIPQDIFDDLCIRADAEGLQISVHAVGDGAVRMVLNGYEAARRANGPRDSRHRIEHIDVIDPADLPRLAELGVIASMQPVHPPGSAGLPLEPTTSIIGRAKWPMAWNWRAIVDSSVVMAFGTDWPVSPLDPLFAIQCAMTRKLWADGLPDPRLTLEECFAAYTSGGAYASFDENRLGRLVPGMKADLALLQGDMDSLRHDGPLKIKAALTICDGQITFEDLPA
jgi:predicted amidohydrolase YtcJ